MARLVELGVLRRERHGQYWPVSPRTALSALLAKRRADSEAAFAAVGDAVDDLASGYRASRRQGDPTELVEVITREVAVTLRVSELTRDLLDRGVDIRSIYTPEALEQPGRFELITRLAQLGEQARFLPTLPFRLRIMDRRVALVALIGGRYEAAAQRALDAGLDVVMDRCRAIEWARHRGESACVGRDRRSGGTAGGGPARATG